MKELIKEKLKKYDYEYSEYNNNLSIDMGMSLYIEIEFKGNDSIKIIDKLKGWNVLTGMIPMSIKTAMIYQTISLFVATFLLFFIGRTSDYSLIPFLFILVGISVWIILWSFYFLTKSENMKKQIILWIDQNEKNLI